MIAVDTNILVYAHREDSDWHEKALPAMVELAESGVRWAIPWPCIHEFLSIVTHPRIYSPPTPVNKALDCMEVWLESSACQPIGESPAYLTNLERLLEGGQAVGGKVHDARVAAICLDHGIKALWTMDRDFSRFPALKTVNPLV